MTALGERTGDHPALRAPLQRRGVKAKPSTLVEGI